MSLHSTGVRRRNEAKNNTKRERREVMQAHGFRKFFDTTCTLNGMDGLYVDHVHSSSQELLEGNDHKLGYVSVIDALTINEENRLRRENEMLKVNKSEIEQLKEKAEQYESFMSKFNPKIEAFQREINSLKLHLKNDINDKK
jgi:hypothetical protein